MTTTAPPPAQADPYALRAEDARPAPETFRDRLRKLGPGLVLSAAVVGSGELITTTSLGAKAGFALLWLVIVSTGVKVWVQMELARWTILNGRPALDGFRDVGPRIGRLSWINWVWIGMDFAKMFQRGGIIGGTAAACSILLPIHGAALSTSSLTIWALIVTGGAILILQTGKYHVVERVEVVGITLKTVITLGLALALPLTAFGYGTEQLAGGLSFQIPAGTVGIALAMFGITGVGADEMTTYTYWCLEKGYARWTGPDDGSEERARRAEGWLKVMRLDVAVSWLVCTICTLSFYVIGASVLHPQGLMPEGNDMITTLSRIYTDTLGPWAEYLFLAGAIAVLFSVTVASSASVPRLWTNTLGLLGVVDWHDMRSRTRTIRILTCCLPPVWMCIFLWIQSPVLMVQIGGIGGGVFLLAVVVAVWRLRYTGVPKRFRNNPWLTAALVVSSLAILGVGVYGILETLGVVSEG
ncbi:Nramp family divalent metal transporter [Streptomyces sp. NBC_01795]|uniref:Nramp family divalent metal transporter n=1 Tax=unclassified Streptomyces TaxID=2593676 RepID=UPI002DDC04F1|nr:MULTISPECIES: Nramp family divalent metal transporter [unclassified Streptomyces]WSA91397.1 Nramp family divalent metal transporter [Streptomyces sp. NBC_01795]WSB75721.1 Nramp family divalent metal transporter [Streptomyces sp. NBC_01775]WSS15994.1 Nramp family divalent metal transporter [Streptomyces sp. NBC_01186]